MGKKNLTNYQVTIGYKAVLAVTVKAENEEEAKKKGLEEFEPYRHFDRNLGCSLLMAT